MPTWEEICDDPALKDLPYKMEMDRQGRIVLTPVKNIHGWLQAKIASRLQLSLPAGEVITECAIETAEGTKVADVAWLTPEHFAVAKEAAACAQLSFNDLAGQSVRQGHQLFIERRLSGSLSSHYGYIVKVILISNCQDYCCLF